MANEDKSGESFLSRWSRRKVEVKRDPAAANQSPPAAPLTAPATVAIAVPVETKANPSIGATHEAKMPQEVRQERTSASAAGAAPLPSVESLTRESDFAPFMRADVTPEMRNQAMKKLFTDPHYNVMDRLDIYIDDYGKPDPIPPEMLRMMNQSKTLGLFEEEERAEEEARRAALGEEAVAETPAAEATTETPSAADADSASAPTAIDAESRPVDAENSTFPFAPVAPESARPPHLK